MTDGELHAICQDIAQYLSFNTGTALMCLCRYSYATTRCDRVHDLTSARWHMMREAALNGVDGADYMWPTGEAEARMAAAIDKVLATEPKPPLGTTLRLLHPLLGEDEEHDLALETMEEIDDALAALQPQYQPEPEGE